jgi:hypothetical protein
MGNTSHFSPLYIHKHNNDGNLGGKSHGGQRNI